MPRKPDVAVELDQQIHATPFRMCAIRIDTMDFGDYDLERVRVALAQVISNPEVKVLRIGPASLINHRKIVRLQANYYGPPADASKIEQAIRSVL